MIGRLVRLLSPRHILLAGARDEALCRALAEAASGCQATLHVAARDVPAWLKALQAEAGDHLMIHAAASVEAVGVLPVPQFAWIDEDPNWFTVHGVLDALLRQAGRLDRPFPVTLVSGIGWPHGRRDSYTDPDAIPAAFRHEHQRAAPAPRQPSPATVAQPDTGFGTLAGGGPRNGVLTAVEDFMSGQAAGLCLAQLPGFGGLAAITPAAGPGAEAFSPAARVADLTLLASELEAARLRAEAALRPTEAGTSTNSPPARLRPLPGPAPAAASAIVSPARSDGDDPPSYEGDPPTDAEAPDLACLRASPVFDAAWYLERNGDVSASRVDPALHYLRHGAAERRDPNPFFSTGYYLDAYADVAGAKLNPVLHYLRHGATEGRNPGPRFATRLYAEAHPEVAAAGVNPLEHFLTVGMRAGWQAPRVPQ